MTYFSKKKKKLYARLKNKPDLRFRCDFCGLGYHIWVGTQAIHCASQVVTENDTNKQNIYSAYGSNYDTCKFIVSPNVNLKGINICDNCITNLLVKKVIVEDKTYNYWDSILQEVYEAEIDPAIIQSFRDKYPNLVQESQELLDNLSDLNN